MDRQIGRTERNILGINPEYKAVTKLIGTDMFDRLPLHKISAPRSFYSIITLPSRRNCLPTIIIA